MNKDNLFLTLAGTTLGCFLGMNGVDAATLTHISSDTAMNALMKDIAFVAEGRIGDRGGYATHELNLHEADPGQPDITEQYNWSNGGTEQFELSFDAASSLVSFTLGEDTLTHHYIDSFSDIFLRTRATESGSQMTVNNLILDGETLEGYSQANAATGGLDILRISDLTQNFNLQGDVTMDWDEENTPFQAQLAFQIKVAQTEDTPKPKEVPEPTAIASLFLFGLVLRRLHRP